MRLSLLSSAGVMTVLVLLTSCGGGGSSGGPPEIDTVSLTVQGGGTTVYTEATSTAASAGYSPYLTVSYPSPSTGTYLYSLAWNGSSYDTRFQIHVWGGAAATYTVGSGNFVYFDPAGGPTYSAVSTSAGASGTITFSEFGQPGEKVRGTFDVVSTVIGGGTPTARLTGSFSVTRQ